jgi:putative spermidine/putrescine transport system permease protein
MTADISRNGGSALAFHVLFMAFVLTPLFAVCITAFTPENYLSVPRDEFSLRWFRTLLHRTDFQRATWLSFRLAAVAATSAVIVATPAALVLARHRFIGRDALSALLMSPLMIPHVVLGIALLRYLARIGLGATFAGLAAGHVLLVTPFALRLVMASAVAMDQRIHQAAISLGAGPFVILRRVTLPLVLPGIVSGWILAFIVSFDEVAMTVFLVAPGTETLPLRMLNHIQDTTDPLIAAMSAILIAGTAAIAILLDRLYGLDRLLGGRE